MKKQIKTDVTENEIEKKEEDGLRPTALGGYVGQENIIKNISIAIRAAKERNDALGHTLFYGPPGLGKTTLSQIIAGEMGKRLVTLSGAAVEKTGDLVAALSSLQTGDVLFIDEIHRLPKFVEETLYGAMEDYQVNIIIGKEEQGKCITMELPHFTLVGATTKAGMISSPLRDRFTAVYRMEYYTDDELSSIIITDAKKMGFTINSDAAGYLASCSRGTPRIAIQIVKRLRDYVQLSRTEELCLDDAVRYMAVIGYDQNGLTKADRDYLSLLQTAGKPLGLVTIAAALAEDCGTVEDMIEPYLLRKEYIIKTARGREILKMPA